MATKQKDEIDKVNQDEETTPEDTLETTPEEEKASPDDERITLSRKELNDRLSQAGVETGRALKAALSANEALKKQYDQLSTNFNDQSSTIESLKKASREAEIARANGDKGIIDSLTLRHEAEDMMDKAKNERSEVEKLRTQYQADIDAALKSTAENEARELAKKSGLSFDSLMSIASDTAENGRVTYNLERMKTVARSVPKAEEREEEEGNEPGNTVRGQRARAARAQGGGNKGLNTMADYDEAYNSGLISVEEYAKARERFGVI